MKRRINGLQGEVAREADVSGAINGAAVIRRTDISGCPHESQAGQPHETMQAIGRNDDSTR